MNKRSLLNLAMCSLLLGSLPVGLVGCKDYDGDIEDLNTTTSKLDSQLSSLNTALEAARTAATNAANDAKAAQDTATAAEALARQAVEEAKAEAISAAASEVEKLMAGAPTAEDLAALNGKIEAIQADLSEIDMDEVNGEIGKLGTAISDINKQLEAIDVQQKALDKLQESLKTLSGDVSGMNTAIGDIQKDLKIAKDKAEANAKAIEANDKAISEIEGEIKDINDELKGIAGKISEEVSNSVNALSTLLSGRLTSITLIPDLYVGGIPTIEFESAKYTKKVFKNNQWEPATEGQTEFIITNNSTQAQYRLNPSTLKIEDIDVAGMSYVTEVATTRAAGAELVTVKNADIKNGRLVVNLGKATTTSLNRPEANKINTVSLKVPVAKERLLEGETSANVYSEYTRLAETYFKPELRFAQNEDGVCVALNSVNNGHLWIGNDSVKLYDSAENALIAQNIVYNDSYDLNDLVEGCKFFDSSNSHVNISVADLEKYGLGIKYAVATREYKPTTPDGTNQQAFAKINGSILTPIASSGAEGNKNIIGKQPIIRATLYDLNNNNVIEVGYFKVKFTAEDMNPVTIELSVKDTDGTACAGATHKFTWDYMAEQVLEQLNNKEGMSKEDFVHIYRGYMISGNEANENTVLTVSQVWNNLDAATPVMTWTASPVDLGVLVQGKTNSKEFHKTVTFKNYQGLYPDVVLKLTWTVETNVPTVALGSTSPIKWNNNTMKITVVPMEIPYTATSPKAHYDTNILEGRNKPYVTGLTSCATYNIAYAPVAEQPQAYVGEALSGFTSWALTNETQKDLNEIGYVIANTANGQKLVNSGKTVKVDFWSNINGLAMNNFKIGSINLEVVKILNLNLNAAAGITDNSQEVAFNLVNNIRITDAYNNVVANKNSSANSHEGDYWNFYGVQDPEFNVDGIKVSLSADGSNATTLAENNMTASIENGETLKFKNNGGVIQSDFYLIVPVTIEHLWGTKQNGTALTGNIIVPVKAAKVQ